MNPGRSRATFWLSQKSKIAPGATETAESVNCVGLKSWATCIFQSDCHDIPQYRFRKLAYPGLFDSRYKTGRSKCILGAWLARKCNVTAHKISLKGKLVALCQHIHDILG